MSVATIKLTPTGLAVLIASFCLILVFYLRANTTNVKQAEEISLKQLLIWAIKLSQDGGEQVSNVHKTAKLNTKSKGKTHEGANDPRTDADLFSHRVITNGLHKQFPQLQVISEEHDDKMNIVDDLVAGESIETAKVDGLEDIEDRVVLVRDVTVWVDPLDATQEFTEGLLHYVTTMICVAVKGRPVMGVIHKPFYKQTFWGWVGVAKSSNLMNRADRKDAKPKIIISRSHAGMVRDVIAAFGNETDVINAGGAGYKTLEVINGNVDAYVHITEIKKWDLCAANALLDCIGGKMTTLSGHDIEYGSDTSVVNHGGLLGAVKDHGKYLNLLKAFRPVFE